MKTFFFAPVCPRMLARIRVALGLLLLYDAAWRWPYAVELYSSAGLPMPLMPNSVLVPPTPTAFWAVVLDTLQLFALAAATLGWCTRFSLLAAAVLMTWLGLLDFPGTFAKYSVISIHLLVLLAVSGSHRVWSIDAWVGRWNRGQCRLVPIWPQRLIALMLCAVYFGAGLTKVRMPEFANGDLLMYSLLDNFWGSGELSSWLASHPHLLALSSLAVMLFELVAPFLFWVPALRKPVWLLAVLLHVGMAALMHLSIFSPVM
ncbi:MAG TPA: HTTM domain-containing protein, partial [Planctomycetaceae bacterium]|nr:HTTM domain-containing protein [Planctomycetaceae bacterium]